MRIVVALTCLAILAGCGGSDDPPAKADGSAPEPASPTAQVLELGKSDVEVVGTARPVVADQP